MQTNEDAVVGTKKEIEENNPISIKKEIYFLKSTHADIQTQ